MITRTIFIALICATVTQVRAANWTLLGKNETVEVFIDLDSIKDEGVAKKVNSYRNLLQSPNPNYKSLENEYSIFCQEYTYIEFNPIIYSDYNRVGPVARGTFSQDKKNIDSKNSIPGVIAQYACNKQSKIINNYENTTWRGIDNGREYEITLLTNGLGSYKFHNGASLVSIDNFKWRQDGSNIHIETNNKFVERSGVVTGDTFSGTAKNIQGKQWSFTYKLIPPGSQPFNPSKDLALEQNRRLAQSQQSNSPQTQQQPQPQDSSQLVKLKEFLKSNWPQWDENTVNGAIKFEFEKIKNKNPSFNDEQILNETVLLWESRAKAKNNPPQEPVKIKNSVELANVHSLAWNHIYSIPNIQVCEPRIPNTKCIDFNIYKKSCAAAKNISHQAARLSAYTDQFPARLIERNGSFSNVRVKWEGEKCTFSYEVWANFNGKLEGCRVFGLATGFAISDQNQLVINMSSHLLPEPAGSTCRLN